MNNIQVSDLFFGGDWFSLLYKPKNNDIEYSQDDFNLKINTDVGIKNIPVNIYPTTTRSDIINILCPNIFLDDKKNDDKIKINLNKIHKINLFNKELTNISTNVKLNNSKFKLLYYLRNIDIYKLQFQNDITYYIIGEAHITKMKKENKKIIDLIFNSSNHDKTIICELDNSRKVIVRKKLLGKKINESELFKFIVYHTKEKLNLKDLLYKIVDSNIFKIYLNSIIGLMIILDCIINLTNHYKLNVILPKYKIIINYSDIRTKIDIDFMHICMDLHILIYNIYFFKFYTHFFMGKLVKIIYNLNLKCYYFINKYFEIIIYLKLDKLINNKQYLQKEIIEDLDIYKKYIKKDYDTYYNKCKAVIELHNFLNDNKSIIIISNLTKFIASNPIYKEKDMLLLEKSTYSMENDIHKQLKKSNQDIFLIVGKAHVSYHFHYIIAMNEGKLKF